MNYAPSPMDILDPKINDYMRGLASRHDEHVVVEMEGYASEQGFPIVGRLCGITIEIMARAIGARRVFELGSGYGYSAYWFARAVGESGEVNCTDGDPANETKAGDYLTRAGVWDRIDFHVGDALTNLRKVDGDFDVVYCDVDKDGYPECWQYAKERIRTGGLWICDNTLWSGRVLDADPDDTTGAIIEHNKMVSEDPDFLSIIVPIRDGLMVALKTG